MNEGSGLGGNYPVEGPNRKEKATKRKIASKTSPGVKKHTRPNNGGSS